MVVKKTAPSPEGTTLLFYIVPSGLVLIMFHFLGLKPPGYMTLPLRGKRKTLNNYLRHAKFMSSILMS